MGRAYYAYSPDGAWSRVRHGLGVPPNLSCPTGTVVHERSDQGAAGADYIVAYTCKDVLGREIRSAARAFDGGWIFSDTRYDYAARAVEVSAPYLSGQSAYWTRSVYDEIGRVETLRAPDPANGSPLDTWDWSMTGSGVSLAIRTTHTNAKGQVHRSDRNALGDKIAETAADGGVTTYGYDALGNLLFTDGPLTGTGDRINITYNALGQKTQMIDPDKGTWQYHSNALGELLCQRDAKSQATRFAYDELGRQTSRTDLSGVTSVTSCTGTQRGITTWTRSNTAGHQASARSPPSRPNMPTASAPTTPRPGAIPTTRWAGCSRSQPQSSMAARSRAATPNGPPSTSTAGCSRPSMPAATRAGCATSTTPAAISAS